MSNGKDIKKKILMFIPSMGSGGAERVIATLANELTIRDYKITILTLTSSESFYPLKTKVNIESAGYTINRKNKLIKNIDMLYYGLKSLVFFRRYILKNQPDIILSFLTHTNIISLIHHIFNNRIPLIISERADPKERSLMIRIITKYLYQFADVLVCQGSKVTKFFPKKMQHKIKIIPNPIDKNSIVSEVPTKRRKAIVGIGRLFPQKNFSLLIESFYKIKDEFPEYVLEIYGEGYLREELQEKINRLKLNNRVFLMGKKRNVMKFVYDAELFVLSSDFEGFPNALIEAMANGLPVISTDFSTGIARELINNENGIVVPVGDKEKMAKAISTILTDRKLREKMGNKNREIINLLSTDKIIDLWIDLFNSVSRRRE